MQEENKCGVMDRTIFECNPPIQNQSGIPRCGICGRDIPVSMESEMEREMESYLQSYTRDQ